MKGIIKKGLAFILLAVLLFVLYKFFFSRYISLETLKQHNLVLQSFVQRHYVCSVMLFIILLVASIIAGLPFVPLFALAAGYLFGTFAGVSYTLCAAIIGAVTAFLIYRYFLYGVIQSRYKKKLAKFEAEVKTNGASYLLMLQFLAVVPFFIITTIAVLANVSVLTVLWTTLLGSLPYIIVYVVAGSQLSTIQSLGDLMSARMIIILGLFALLALLPIVIKKLKSNNDSYQSSDHE